MAEKYYERTAVAVLLAVVYFSAALTVAQDQQTLQRVNTIDALNQKLDDQALELAAVKTMVGALKQELADDIYGARQSLVIFFFCLFLAYKTSSSLWTRLFRYHFWRQHMAKKSDLESQALRELTERNRLLTEQGAALRAINENLMILRTQTGFCASDLQAVVSAVQGVRNAEADAALRAAGLPAGPHRAASCAAGPAAGAVASVKAAPSASAAPAGAGKAAGRTMMPFLMLLGFVLAAGVAAAVWTATGDIFLAGGLAGGSVVVLGLAWSTVRAVGEAMRRRRRGGKLEVSQVPQESVGGVKASSDAHMASPKPEPSSVKPTPADAEPPKTKEETKSNLHAQTPEPPRAEAPAPAQTPQPAPAEPTPAAPAPEPPQNPPAEAPTPEPPQSPTAEAPVTRRLPTPVNLEAIIHDFINKPQNKRILKHIVKNPGCSLQDISRDVRKAQAGVHRITEQAIDLHLLTKKQEMVTYTTKGGGKLTHKLNFYNLVEGVSLD